MDMPYTFPQEELVKLFSRCCNKHISSILIIQQHQTFKEALAQSKFIEEAKIQDGEIKLRKKGNNN